MTPRLLAEEAGTLKEFDAALAKLEQRDVTILGLHYIEDLTYQEIAKTLGITPSRVCQLLWRAVERLRGHLGVEQAPLHVANAVQHAVAA